MGLLDILLITFAVILILLSLLQSGKSDGLSSAFTGGDGLNLFANVKERGAEKTMSNLYEQIMGEVIMIVHTKKDEYRIRRNYGYRIKNYGNHSATKISRDDNTAIWGTATNNRQ